MSEFEEFPKIARLNRDILVTEKIDGTNAQVFIGPGGDVRAGSRSRWIAPEADNFGFAAWVRDNAEALFLALGPGRHFGEWWGSGIQRGYGLRNGERRFSLFNAARWHVGGSTPVETRSADPRQPSRFSAEVPAFLGVVPILYRGPFRTDEIEACIERLRGVGSVVAPGFMKPEGIVVFHMAAGVGFKATLDGDGMPKSLLSALRAGAKS